MSQIELGFLLLEVENTLTDIKGIHAGDGKKLLVWKWKENTIIEIKRKKL